MAHIGANLIQKAVSSEVSFEGAEKVANAVNRTEISILLHPGGSKSGHYSSSQSSKEDPRCFVELFYFERLILLHSVHRQRFYSVLNKISG